MVNTLVMYDVPDRQNRQRLESLLRGGGFAYLFPYARWSPAPMSRHCALARAIRARLHGGTYRMVFIEVNGASRTGATWVTAHTDQRPRTFD